MLRKLFTTPFLAISTFLLAALFWGYHRLNPLLFNPVNGDFQTFNPISRLLSGQLPYHDFANYLGIGPLALTTLAALPSGLTFAGSIVSTEILVSLAFLYMATTAFRLLGTPKPWLFAIALYFLGRLGFFMELLPGHPVSYGTTLFTKTLTTYLGLRNLVSPGHSLMPLRVLWPFLAAVPLVFYIKAPSTQRAALLGGTLGAGLLWSNDYGPTTALAFGLVAAFATRNLKHVTLAVVVALATAALAVIVVTGGHPADWLAFNRAVTQDQFWYYYFPDKKIISLDMLDLDEATWVLLIVLVTGVGVLQHVMRNPTPNMLAFLAVFAAALLAGLLSMFGSSWFSYYLTAPLFLSVVFLLNQGSTWILARVNPDGIPVRAVLGATAIGFIVAFVLHPSFRATSTDEVTLGAKLHSHYDSFDNLMKRVRAGDPSVWSTYSTAIEASLGVHQPTGQDYIIHALGDTGREKYLKGFHTAKPRLVITPNPDKILWEVWSRIVNWWFYRELLQGYKPVAHDAFWTVWERTGEQNRPVSMLSCTSHQDAPGTVRIVVNGGPKIAGHVADVRLTYSAESPWYTRLALEVVDEGLIRHYKRALKQAGIDSSKYVGQSSVGFPPNAGEWLIPIQLDDQGKGISTIHANLRSAAGAKLTVHSCKASDWASAGRIDQ